MSKELEKMIKETKLVWNCRSHPTDSWHEVGCPHQEWTNKQLQEALEAAKISLSWHKDIIISAVPTNPISTTEHER